MQREPLGKVTIKFEVTISVCTADSSCGKET